MSTILLALVLACFAPWLISCSSTVPLGGPCAISNNRVDPFSHKFQTDCDDTTFCMAPVNSTSATCQRKRCRRDEYPFGFLKLNDTAASTRALPPMCGKGQYCPDEEDGCRMALPAGSTCQMNRDEQCASFADTNSTTSTVSESSGQTSLASQFNLNVNEKALCLNNTCMFVNTSLGHPCVADRQVYIDMGPDGHTYSNIVTRDNCQRPDFYCDFDMKVCQHTKNLGDGCSENRECATDECSTQRVCAKPADTPLGVAPWQYGVSAFSIVAAMIAVCTLLVTVHKRHRLRRYRELREYHAEQLQLRRSMIAIHSSVYQDYKDDKL